ncbi:MAG TPA: 2'-5' RNA ligase family protein, partial [Chitinophagales bacterium]|nr:2'-5' RNA ligase family protein [Chitinophagales bacterium]
PLCSPFSLVYKPLPSRLVAADLKNDANKQVEIVGYYVTRKPTSTKKGEAMMFGCFLDKEGYFFDTNHFPDATRNFPFRGKGCYVIKGRVAEEFEFYSINVTEMYRLDYVMYEESAEEQARSRPDPVIVPPVVAASRQMEYLLVISPPPHVSNEVMLLKKIFHRQFDHYGAVVTKPHITLCNFVQSEDLEQELLKRIALVAQKHAAFRVSLDGFDGFPYHTIFIKVLHADPVTQIVTELKQQLKLPLKYSSFSMKPHLTIARGLDKEKFSRASAEFFEREYKASFVSAGMVLLKKDAAAKFGKYEVVKEFTLEGKQKHNSHHNLNITINQ